MLYSFYDWQQTALAPWRMMAQAGLQVFSHPDLPLSETRYGRAMAATFELMERSMRRYEKPAFGLEETLIGKRWVQIEEEVVLKKDFGNLLHFKRDIRRKDPKVLIVAPMSGHYATLLRGTVAAMLPDHDVYITDWIDARDVPLTAGRFDLDDYVSYVIEFLQFLGPRAHVVAVCQPSVPVMAACSVMAGDDDPLRPASMTLMGGPIDTRINPTQVNEFATTRPLSWFEQAVVQSVPFGYAGAGRRVYPGFLQLTGFMSMNIDRHFGAHMRLFDHLVTGDGDSAEAHRKFYDEYLSVMDMTAEFYLETVDVVFQRHLLPKGEWVSHGKLVKPEKIRDIALLTVEGEKDDISAIGQTEAAHRLLPNLPKDKHQHYMQKSVGHYGIFNGRRWREQIYPRLRDFIRANR